jgi:F0F1-type ATP synthase membrane subunit b/b'
MRRFSPVAFAALLLLAVPAFAEDTKAEAQAMGEPAMVVESEAAHHHAPSFADINWFYGWLGERAGVTPSLAFRPKGMPAPFGIWLLDAAVLYGFLIRIAKKPLQKALKDRKANILRGMDEAARMKRDAERRLEQYEDKLSRIEEEVERVRREMRESAEAERVRILADARARRERMEKDAHLLVQQELAAARDALRGEMVKAAMISAATAVQGRLQNEDQQRLADEYLAGLTKAGSALRARA